MRRALLYCSVAITAGTLVRGGPMDSMVIAAMSFAEARSYEWSAAVQDDSRFYTIEGKTTSEGYTIVNRPMVGSFQYRLGNSRSDVHTAIFKGNVDCVIETPDGWKTPEELMALPFYETRKNTGASRRAPRPGGSRGVPGGPLPSTFRYSNLQQNLSHPHDEIGIIIGSYLEIHADALGASGTLSEDGARCLLIHPGQDEITARDTSGTFKLWFHDGELVRYDVDLIGKISVGPVVDRREFTVHQKVTTDLKNVGTTEVDVPEEARRKLR